MVGRDSEPDTDIDLSAIVTRMSKVRKATRQRLANDVVTRAILAAATRLMDAQFSPDEAVPDDGRRNDLFLWLSRRRIAVEIVNLEKPISEEARETRINYFVHVMEQRWTPHELLIEDFLAYVISVRHWSLHREVPAAHREMLLGDLRNGDFVQAVREVTHADLSVPALAPAILRMQLLAAVISDRDPEIHAILDGIYKAVDDQWIDLYKSIFAVRGWALRSDVTFEDLNLMLSTAAEGMALRALISPAGIVDSGTKDNLLAKLGLGLIASCVDTGDGLSLQALVERLPASGHRGA